MRADIDWGSLVPVLVLIIYGISWLFNKGQRADDVEAEERPRSQEEAEEAERRRKLREEIRRQIAERQGEPSEERQTRQQPQQTFRQEPQPRPEPPRPQPAGQPQGYGRGLEEEYARQLDRLRESEAHRREALRKAWKGAPPIMKEAQQSERAEVLHGMRDDIFAVLGDTQGLRKAILYQEILGKPVGAREDGRGGHESW